MIYVKEYSVYISSESIIVSSLTFRFMIHFQFIFVYGVRECPISFFYSFPVFPAPLTEETVFSSFYMLASFVID